MIRSLLASLAVTSLVGCAGQSTLTAGSVPSFAQPRQIALRVGVTPNVKRCPAWPSGSGILDDGDFHLAPDPGNWQTYYKGQGFAPGWTVTKRSIDVYGGLVNKFPGGTCSIDLDGFHPGEIRSGWFRTTPNAQYTVTFLLSGNGGGPPTIKTMQVEAAEQSETLQWDVSNGNGAENGHYQQETWSFAAASSRTRLTFTSLDPNPKGQIAGWGPVIAAVSVTKN